MLHKTLSAAITDALRERDVAFDKLKKEVRKGLMNVNDSIADLQQVYYFIICFTYYS